MQNEGGEGPDAEPQREGFDRSLFFEATDCRCVDFFVYICIVDC